MQTLFQKVAGFDIHKKVIVACVRITSDGGRVKQETKTFGTMTDDLIALFDWCRSHGVTHIAMESTGVFWKPIWNLFDNGSFELLLVNPKELKQVPGRKSDVKDSQWIAQLLACGLLRSSFVPERPQRELRDLTRQRAQLHGEHTRCVNRIHKVLQDANIKLSSVATDVMGVSGRDMLAALITGNLDPDEMAELAQGKLRAKIPDLKRALTGKMTDHHRFLLEQYLDHVAHLEQQIEIFSERIKKALRPFVDEALMEVLDEIPGVNVEMIENVIAEIGVDMSQFPTAGHLSSWTGVCPGNETSAGKRKKSGTTKGNTWLRRALCQAAWGASRTKNSYFQSQYRRLAGRRGKKRAAVAVGRGILEVFYVLLSNRELRYRDLGGDYFDKLDPERLCRHLVKRIESLGYDVDLRLNSAV
ncbi:IS110 family RNA-guided transposase [Rhodopirellula baltica]|uniref:Transposase IS116/IS110/IS902 family protein n=1 Tax=Rhodopirellula baltica SWK14 TaxID=993516 RepID=L7CJK6_RHOBT|nr:IS110 family transposase [Rhodopirellula baltica]ELP33261.1 transposase IS116/IS110/IS902 family protein [Rhodopirellula baltica SWK14]